MARNAMQDQMDKMMAMLEQLAKENAQLKADATKVRKLPEITVEGQEKDGYIILRLPVLREAYASDKGKSGTTLATTGFNKAVDVAGMPGVKAVVRVYQPN